MPPIPSYKIPTSHFSDNSSIMFRMSSVQNPPKSSRRTRTSYLEPQVPNTRGSAGSSQSIKIFADVNGLLPSPTGDDFDSTRPHVDSSKDSKQGLISTSQTNHNQDNGTSHSALPTAPKAVYQNPEVQPFEAQESPADILSRKIVDNDWASTKDLVQSFPEPPRQASYRPRRLLSFKKLFPESRYFVDVNQQPPQANFDKVLPQPPYHAFDHQTKRLLVCLLMVVGILSPLSSSIYFPALSAVGKEFKINTLLVLLTVAVHIASHGIAPLLTMPFGERLGRRPLLIINLFSFLGANLGLIFVKSLPGFMLLRALQAASSAPLPIIGAAVIGDIATGKEMEGFTSLFGSGLLISFLIGPILGGIFTQLLNFRIIFWFLSIATSATLFLVIVFLPETHRRIAGNGTIRLRAIQRPGFDIFRRTTLTPFTSSPTTPPPPLLTSFLNPLVCLTHTPILPSIFLGAYIFSVLAVVITTTATLFPPHYHLSPVQIGLIYLPSGAGCVIGFFLMTYRLSSDYNIVSARHASQLLAAMSLTSSSESEESEPPEFPIERARLRSAWWITAILTGTTIGYGFSLSAPSVLRLLILQFFISGNATALLLINSVLITDLYASTPVTAGINLVRFVMGAVMVGTVQLLFERVGTGFTFLGLGVGMAVFGAVMGWQWWFGGSTRRRRRGSVGREGEEMKVMPGTGLVL